MNEETRILAVDTTSMDGSVAVLRGHRLQAEHRWTAIESHSSTLVTQIDGCLRSAGTALGEITHFVPLVGPGSFTGIRIGLGTVQGLASAKGRPMIGVSVLEALAFSVPARECIIMAVVDARRGQVYTQAFQNHEEDVEPLSPASCEFPERWLMELARVPMVFVGSGAVALREHIEAASDSYAVQKSALHLAAPAGELAARRVAAGKVTGQLYLDALYVRPPDVLLSSAKRQA